MGVRCSVTLLAKRHARCTLHVTIAARRPFPHDAVVTFGHRATLVGVACSSRRSSRHRAGRRRTSVPAGKDWRALIGAVKYATDEISDSRVTRLTHSRRSSSRSTVSESHYGAVTFDRSVGV
jgi:hypothetical protein